MPQAYTDLTPRLDELYAKGAFSEFTPDVTKSARKVRRGTPQNINERGAFYLSLVEMPMNFASDDFGSNAGADFGDAGRTSYLKQTVTALKRTSSVKWQDEVEVQSSNPALMQRPGKSVNEKLQLIKNHLKAYAIAFSREMWGDKTNEIARVSAINTGTSTITCANAGNAFGVFNIFKGMDIAVYTSGGTKRTTTSQYVTVASVNPANRTFTYTGTAPGSTANGDYLYPAQGNTGLKDKALAGINYMLGSSGQYQGVPDRTVNQMLCGTRLAAAGAVLSAGWLRKMKSEQQFRQWGVEGEGTFYASSQYDAYEATELGKQSYAQTGDTMRKGYRKLFFDDAPFEKELYVPRDAVVYADLEQIDRFELTPYGPVKDSSGYELPVPSLSGGTYQDNKMVRFRGYEQLGCEIPAKLGVWADGFSTAGLSLGYTS